MCIRDSGAVAGLAPTTRAAVTDVFGRMRTEVIAGQYLDVLVQAQPWGGDPEHDEDLARVRRIGLPLCEAFQLRDDLLGVFGDPATTGKPAGDDLREGKRTVLVAWAIRLAAPADRARLVSSLGHRELGDDDVAELRAVLRRTGADAEVERLIGDLAEPALEELATAPLAEPGRSMLVRLARAAVDRHA